MRVIYGHLAGFIAVAVVWWAFAVVSSLLGKRRRYDLLVGNRMRGLG